MIVGCLYKHSALQINDFKSDFISPLLLKLQKESSKRIFLLGDFNIDVLKYELSDSINNFIDTLSSNFLLPHILLPTRISKTSTLIDNIFSNSTSLEEIESGNVISTFSDHLPQFIFFKYFFSKIPAAKSNILRAIAYSIYLEWDHGGPAIFMVLTHVLEFFETTTQPKF